MATVETEYAAVLLQLSEAVRKNEDSSFFKELLLESSEVWQSWSWHANGGTVSTLNTTEEDNFVLGQQPVVDMKSEENIINTKQMDGRKPKKG